MRNIEDPNRRPAWVGMLGSLSLISMTFGLGMFVVSAMVALMVGILIAITFIWNTVMVDLVGAAPIVSIGGAILFLLGVGCFGRFIGCLGLLVAVVLAITGGMVGWLDMELAAGPMAAYGLFMLIAGSIWKIGSTSRSQRSSRTDRS